MIPQHLPICEIVSIRNAINLTNTEMLVEQILFNLQIPIEQFLFKTISIDHCTGTLLLTRLEWAWDNEYVVEQQSSVESW